MASLDQESQELLHGFKLGLNISWHVFLLFTVLLVAYMVVIAGISRDALVGELDNALKENLDKTLTEQCLDNHLFIQIVKALHILVLALTEV